MFEYYVGNHAPGWKTTYAPREDNALSCLCAQVRKDATPYLDAWVERFKKLKGLEEIEVVRKLSGGDLS